MNKNNYKIANILIPAEAIHPGELLLDEIEYRGITQKELAEKMNLPQTILSEVIRGKKNITPPLALKLEKALDINASYWIRLQVKYDIDTVRIKHRNAIREMKLSRQKKANLSKRVLQYA